MFSYESLISLFLLMPQTLERLESGLIRIYWRLSYFYVITLHCWIVLIFGSLTVLLSYISISYILSLAESYKMVKNRKQKRKY